MLRWFFVLTAVSGLQPSHQPQQQQQKVATRGQFVSFGSLCAALMAPMSANALNPMMSEKKKKGSVSYYEEPPAYLTEPTEEFKKAEADRAKFRQQQAAYKKKWDEVFSEFVASASNDDKLVSSLSDLTKLVSSQRGLPYGLRLSDMITQCRRVKSKASQAGGWGTPVEIEYMNLVREVKRAENPNLSVENTGYL